MNSLPVQPLGWVAKIFDFLMIPFMYLIAGTLSEAPQRTHKWNNRWLTAREIDYVQSTNGSSVFLEGDPDAGEVRYVLGVPLFHLPFLKWWQRYVVLEPEVSGTTWYCGWYTSDTTGKISRLPITGPVRMLLGPSPVTFFGIDTQTGEKIGITLRGWGHFGDNSSHRKIRLH